MLLPHRTTQLKLRITKNLEEEMEEASGVETSMTETEVVDYIHYVMKENHGNEKQ